MTRRPGLTLAGLAGLLILALALAGAVGSTPLPLDRAWAALWGQPLQPLDRVVLWELRLPRVLLAATVGAALALAGAALQGLFRNPLADPSVLGVSAGGALGAASALVLGLGSPVGGALLGAGGALALLLSLTRGVLGRSLSAVLLAGLAVGLTLSALLSLVLLSARGRAPEVYLWLLGSLAGRGWPAVAWTAGALALGGGLLLASARSLDALGLGLEVAASLGVRLAAARWTVLLGAAVLVAGATAFAGLIGFVGLVVPAAARALVGRRHGLLLPASALGGAVVLVLADLLARWAPPQEVPVGVVTGLVGGPVFVGILRRALARPGAAP